MDNDEAQRMRMYPGIDFADGVTGRRARIAGTGIEVWEVIEEYQEVKGDVTKVKQAFSHLTENQLVAAINYYHAYPGEINARIKANEASTG